MARDSRKRKPRLLADENIPTFPVQSLKKQGFDVTSLLEFSEAGMSTKGFTS
jgi:hypothetical protein